MKLTDKRLQELLKIAGRLPQANWEDDHWHDRAGRPHTVVRTDPADGTKTINLANLLVAQHIATFDPPTVTKLLKELVRLRAKK